MEINGTYLALILLGMIMGAILTGAMLVLIGEWNKGTGEDER